MKSFYVITVLMSLLLVANNALSQSYTKSYNGTVYTVSSNHTDEKTKALKRIIISSADSAEFVSIKGPTGYLCSVEQPFPLSEIIKKTIPMEKIKLFASEQGNMIFIYFYYNRETGKIVYMRFLLRGEINLTFENESDKFITLSEINSLEQEFKKYYFKLSKCDNIDKSKLGNFVAPFRFSNLVE